MLNIALKKILSNHKNGPNNFFYFLIVQNSKKVQYISYIPSKLMEAAGKIKGYVLKIIDRFSRHFSGTAKVNSR